jgi:hypothetical protein
MVQIVEHLPSTCEALNSLSSTAKKIMGKGYSLVVEHLPSIL